MTAGTATTERPRCLEEKRGILWCQWWLRKEDGEAGEVGGSFVSSTSQEGGLGGRTTLVGGGYA